MKPTDEQKAILESSHRVIRVNARAGTGKTTTLNMMARKHSGEKLIYLVFNRRGKEEADTLFPENVKSYTLHSLAFRYEGRKWKDHIGHFSPSDALDAFRSDQQALANLTHGFLTFFLNSPLERLEEAAGPFQVHLKDEALALFKLRSVKIVQAARDIATAWNRKEMPCPHDFYLKLFHKSGAFHRALHQYDRVLVDEGQDLSPIMLDALAKCKKKVVIVGDTHQQIYSFRYATDAIRQLACDREYDLTLSFRFGKPIADLATLFIREAKKEKHFRIVGNPEKSSRIAFYQTLENINKNDVAILSRTNFSLFANAMNLRSRGKAFSFERDIQSILWRTLDVYRLFQEDRDKIKDKFIASFEDGARLKQYAEEMDDFQLKGMCQIVARFSREFPEVAFEMAQLCKGESPAQNTITLSTIHSAKGRQYADVFMDPDLALALESEGIKTIPEDEINLVYVGFTRAKENLYLPNAFLSVMTPKWRTGMERIKMSRAKRRKISTPSKIPGHPSVPAVPGPAKIIRQEASVPRVQDHLGYEPGDRVSTSMGLGTILEIRGRECLVDLENQIAKVWQPLREILKVLK
ncbi:MAG: AAA family ATPase [Proteobacteria bacterium]|nr:AAA family ATPase [Pseudomonadota bacterium]